MPGQETFLTAKNGDELIEVVKTYDQVFAREVFRKMDREALAHLAASLDLESAFEPTDIPTPMDENYENFIWDVMVDSAREDWNSFSYFVVTKSFGRRIEEVFVSGDWRSAETYVKQMGIPETAADQSTT